MELQPLAAFPYFRDEASCGTKNKKKNTCSTTYKVSTTNVKTHKINVYHLLLYNKNKIKEIKRGSGPTFNLKDEKKLYRK